MKTLKEYIIEGIFDIEDNIENLSVESLIEDFIKENYEVENSPYYYERSLQIKKKGNKYIVSAKSGVKVINKNITELTNGLFEWGEVEGRFLCSDCTSLKSLEGAPKEVGRDFICSSCTSLKSLKGAPKEVGGNFYCIGCISLKDLKGASEKIGMSFDCNDCTTLKSLKGAPKEIKFDFTCMECTSLESLEGAPEKVGRDFYCSGCTALKSLKGAPKKVGRDFIYNRCGKKFTEEDVRAVCDVEDEIYI